jgi:hypothetical protein
MVNDKLNSVVDSLETFLSKNGFKRKGKSFRFLKKYKSDHKREELVSFTARQHRNDVNAIYISCTIGIYYPTVRKIYQQICDNHLSKYPIIAGSISRFSQKKEYMSICYKEDVNKKEIISYIEEEITDGAFVLIQNFPNLEIIYREIKSKNFLLKNILWGAISKEDQILILSIIYVLKGMDGIINEIAQYIEDEKGIKKLIEKFQTIK